MEYEIYTLEALAHYTRGGVTLFFIFWSVLLNRYKARSRMMKLLFVASCLISICYAKDVVFTIYEIKYSEYINCISGIIDMVYIPVIAAFFLEVAWPGIVTSRQLTAAVVLQAIFLPVYLVCPSDTVVVMALSVAYCMSAVTVVCVTVFVIKYRRMMFDNYSYTENVDVLWVLFSCYAYFGTHVLYSLAFKNTTWLSETIFNITGMILWAVVFRLAQRHRALKMFLGRTNATADGMDNDMPMDGDLEEEEDFDTDIKETDIMQKIEENTPNDNVRLERERIIESRLQQIMEQQKLYLMPKLSIIDLAARIGTNKTYISDYLNNKLHMTFHDYVNQLRIEEARSIISSMSYDNRRTMVDVATSSGFNSISSFNRQFVKFVGISPKQYFLEQCESDKPDDETNDLCEL